MTRRLFAARPAAEELEAAVRWYVEQRPDLGSQFYEAVLRTMGRIAEMPEAGPRIGRMNARRMLVAGFPYQIVYRLHANEIRIIAIAHLKRRPQFWQHRR